jgi:polyphosphate kinase 2 (PPK2 family)
MHGHELQGADAAREGARLHVAGTTSRRRRRGIIGIFNRSHYESVLVERVHNYAPEPIWQGRYDHINAWERMLADEGVTILKFFLHISKDEQKRRLESRLAEPHKHWKFNPGDLKERERWDDYMAAYQDALARCSTEAARGTACRPTGSGTATG